MSHTELLAKAVAKFGGKIDATRCQDAYTAILQAQNDFKDLPSFWKTLADELLSTKSFEEVKQHLLSSFQTPRENEVLTAETLTPSTKDEAKKRRRLSMSTLSAPAYNTRAAAKKNKKEALPSSDYDSDATNSEPPGR